MGYESYVEKTETYKQEKQMLDTEVDLFLTEETQIQDITTEKELFDTEIQMEFLEIERIFEIEKMSLENQASSLASEKKKLVEDIKKEMQKLDDAQKRIDRVLSDKYVGNMEEVAEKCSQYTKEFERMLNELEEITQGGSGTMSGGLERTHATAIPSSENNDGTFVQRQIDDATSIMKGYSLIVGEHNIEADLIATNPNYSYVDATSPWNNNCQRCVSAYEARRRGYDVVAQPVPYGADSLPIMRHPEGWPSVYQGANLINCSANSGTGAKINVEEEIKSWGSDSRAIVRVRWKPECGGGGHVFIAERVNGKTRFIDPQNANTDASAYFDCAKGSDVYCMRIDNLPFSERIHQCCRQRTA